MLKKWNSDKAPIAMVSFGRMQLVLALHLRVLNLGDRKDSYCREEQRGKARQRQDPASTPVFYVTTSPVGVF
jgi:hypothetical protein